MQTLRELLKPPFYKNINEKGFVRIYDNAGLLLFLTQSFFYLEEQGQSDLADFTVAALNGKAAREWGERKRWVKRDGTWKCRCPECLKDNGFQEYDSSKSEYANFCPSCGERLDPPEEAK